MYSYYFIYPAWLLFKLKYLKSRLASDSKSKVHFNYVILFFFYYKILIMSYLRIAWAHRYDQFGVYCSHYLLVHYSTIFRSILPLCILLLFPLSWKKNIILPIPPSPKNKSQNISLKKWKILWLWELELLVLQHP